VAILLRRRIEREVPSRVPVRDPDARGIAKYRDARFTFRFLILDQPYTFAHPEFQ
jgi:hypothetical protein